MNLYFSLTIILGLSFLRLTIQLQCSLAATKLLTKISNLAQRNIGTCTRVTNYSTHIASFLDTCTFTSVASSIDYAECQKLCVLDSTCLALTFSAHNNGCEHCVTGSGNGNGNSYAQSDIMVVGVALRNHIDGMQWICKQQSFTLDSNFAATLLQIYAFRVIMVIFGTVASA